MACFFVRITAAVGAGFGHVPRPRESVKWAQPICDIALRTATTAVLTYDLAGRSFNQPHNQEKSPTEVRLVSWLPKWVYIGTISVTR